MSTKILKCPCGGTYREGSDRHCKTKKHLDYLNHQEKYKDMYNEVIALLMTEKFGGDNRFERSRKYLDKRMEGATDNDRRIRDIRDEFRKRLHMSIQS